MKKTKRPKSTTPTLDKRVDLVLKWLQEANKRRDYIIERLQQQEESLDLIYAKIAWIATPFHVKLWRWLRGKAKKR